MTITGAKIRSIREQLGLTQDQFASLLGIHAVTLSRWENDAPQRPTQHQLDLIKVFAQAADPERAGFEAGRMLARKGPIPALFVLLQWTLGQEAASRKKGG